MVSSGMAIKRVYFGLPLDVLTQMREETLDAIKKAKVSQSYSGGDVGFSLPSLETLQADLAEIEAAISYAKGNYYPLRRSGLSHAE